MKWHDMYTYTYIYIYIYIFTHHNRQESLQGAAQAAQAAPVSSAAAWLGEADTGRFRWWDWSGYIWIPCGYLT